MQSRDARQAVEVGSVQGQDMGHTLRKHHRCKASIVRALASDLGGFDQGEPAFEGSGPFIEQHKLAAQARDYVSGLAGGPSFVPFHRSSGDDPQLGQHLRGQDQRMTRHDEAPDRVLHRGMLGARLISRTTTLVCNNADRPWPYPVARRRSRHCQAPIASALPLLLRIRFCATRSRKTTSIPGMSLRRLAPEGTEHPRSGTRACPSPCAG